MTKTIERKRRQARALHDFALYLGQITGRERDANMVSKEAALADAEIEKMHSEHDASISAMRRGQPHDH